MVTRVQHFGAPRRRGRLAFALAATSFLWSAGELAAQTPAIPTVVPSLSGVKIQVADYDRTLDFYGKLLGLTAGFKFNETEWAMKWPSPEMGPMIIMVLRPALDKGAINKANLVFMVSDVYAIEARLKAEGYPISSGPLKIAAINVSLLFVRDPDGNMLELASVKP